MQHFPGLWFTAFGLRPVCVALVLAPFCAQAVLATPVLFKTNKVSCDLYVDGDRVGTHTGQRLRSVAIVLGRPHSRMQGLVHVFCRTGKHVQEFRT